MSAVTIDVEGCARCGVTHANLTFRPLTQLVRVEGYEFTHWAPCPSNGQPVLLVTTPKEETQ